MGVSMDRCSCTNAHSHSPSQMSESFWNPNTLHIDKDRRVSLRFMYSYGALEQRQRSATRRDARTHIATGVYCINYIHHVLSATKRAGTRQYDFL